MKSSDAAIISAAAAALGWGCGGNTATAPSQGSVGSDASVQESGPPDGLDGGPWQPTAHACGLSSTGTIQLAPPPSGPSLLNCAASGEVSLSSPQLFGPDGGPLAPGSTVTLTVVVNNAGAQGLGYPCVALTADDARVSFSSEGPEDYALLPHGNLTFSASVVLPPDIAAGTRLRFAAWAVWSQGTQADGATGACIEPQPLEWDAVVD
jgi:hypothetical protein